MAEHPSQRRSLGLFVHPLKERALPSVVLLLANPAEAKTCAQILLDEDEDARREFGGSVERLAGFLMSLAVPQVARACALLPNELREESRARALLADAMRKPLPSQQPSSTPSQLPPWPNVAPSPSPSVALSAAQHGAEWGSIDAMAAALGVRVPLLRLPRVRRVLAAMGVVPEDRDGCEVWPLLAVQNVDAVRLEVVRTAASGVAIDDCGTASSFR